MKELQIKIEIMREVMGRFGVKREDIIGDDEVSRDIEKARDDGYEKVSVIMRSLRYSAREIYTGMVRLDVADMFPYRSEQQARFYFLLAPAYCAFFFLVARGWY